MRPSFALVALAPPRQAMLNPLTMIIACPACATRYVVPDSAIGIDGRTVRCAKCKHNWFQEGAPIAPPAPAPVAPPAPAPAPVPPPTAEAPAPVSTPQDEPVAPVASATAEANPAPVAPESGAVPAPPVYTDPSYRSDYTSYDEPSQFDHQPLLAPRRNPARMWMMAAVLFATVSIAAIGATAWYGLPDWMPFARPVFAEEQPGLKLEFPPREQDRYPLPNGTWYFGANGRVTNTSQTPRSVPGILIVLRDSRGLIVHTAEVRSPKRVLAPGESAEIREALVPVPKSGVQVQFGWKPN